MKKIWNKWKRISLFIVNIQANIVLTVIFVILFIPLGFIYRFFNKNNKNKRNFWEKKKKFDSDINFAKQQ